LYHAVRLRWCQPAEVHQSGATNGIRSIHQHYDVECCRIIRLEEQGNVAHDDLVAASAGLFQQREPESADLGMNDSVEVSQGAGIGQDLRSQHRAIESSVGPDYARSEPISNLFQCRLPLRLHLSDQLVCIDDRRAPFGEQLRDGGLSSSDVTG